MTDVSDSESRSPGVAGRVVVSLHLFFLFFGFVEAAHKQVCSCSKASQCSKCLFINICTWDYASLASALLHSEPSDFSFTVFLPLFLSLPFGSNVNFTHCLRLIGLFVFFGRLAPKYGQKQGPLFGARDDSELLKTVLQDSINLLEQVRRSAKAPNVPSLVLAVIVGILSCILSNTLNTGSIDMHSVSGLVFLLGTMYRKHYTVSICNPYDGQKSERRQG